MFLPLDPSSGIPLFRQIGEQVRRMIAAGTLRPGDKLESVRDLAATLQINPLTVGKAYQELEREGIVEMRRGLGMFVAARPAAAGAANEIARRAVERTVERLALEATQAGLGPRETAQMVTDAFRRLRLPAPAPARTTIEQKGRTR
jgi:GntR family transcriptional regulator